MAIRQNNMLDISIDIQAGYFYTFSYKAKNIVGADKNPIIYCAYAPPTSNNFTGINLHYFNLETCAHIIDQMIKKQFILNDDIPHIFNGQELYQCYTNIGYGLREYNKTRILGSCYRIRNPYIPKFLGIPSDFFMSNDTEKEIEQELELSKNKGF